MIGRPLIGKRVYADLIVCQYLNGAATQAVLPQL